MIPASGSQIAYTFCTYEGWKEITAAKDLCHQETRASAYFHHRCMLDAGGFCSLSIAPRYQFLT
jgi:hypothetical protein